MIGAMLAKVDGFWERVYPVVEGSAPPGAGTGGVVDEIQLNGRVFIRHTFTASDDFTVTRSGLFTLFAVGGGGGGGNGNASGYEAGGGGAGLARWQELTKTAGVYPVVIGAGGASGGNGAQSSALDTIAQGGRRGNHGGGAAATDGVGSGGGGSHNMTTASGTKTSPGNGITFAYGGETPVASSSGGGGGGASQAGGTNGLGRGGDGIEFPPGSGVYYAGGGGAIGAGALQAGGLGGGGAGGSVAATANTGSGGGGANGLNVQGGAGGSGIVMVCYERGPVLTPGDGVLTLTWDETPGATYAVEMDGVVVERDQNSPYVVSGLVNGEDHTFRVRENIGGLWGAWSVPVTGAAAPFNEATGGVITEVANYNGTGELWRIHTFNGNSNFVVLDAPSPFRALVVGGGGGGGFHINDGQNRGAGGGYGGQTWADDSLVLDAGSYAITVGNGGGCNGGGSPSTGFGTTRNGGGPGGNCRDAWQTPNGGGGYAYNISGTLITYGANGTAGGNQYTGTQNPNPGGGGGGSGCGWGGDACNGSGGKKGQVVIAYRIG